jgi:hypothetical protein
MTTPLRHLFNFHKRTLPSTHAWHRLLMSFILTVLLLNLTAGVSYSQSLPQLTPLSPTATFALKSANSAVSTYVKFVNAYGAKVDIYWINFSGQVVLFDSLDPGQSYVQQTYLSHPWIIYDHASGSPIVGFLPAEQEAEAFITKPAIPSSTPSDERPLAVRVADAFLKPEQRGRDILSHLHFLADYHGHELLKVVALPEERQYMLIYRFWWYQDGITDVGFLFDLNGKLQHLQVMSTNAQWSPPFTIANGSLKVLGKFIAEKYKDRMNKLEHETLEWIIDNADSKTLLEWRLKLAQSVE